MQARPVPLPGLTERVLVVVALFIFNHETPNAWFVNRADVTDPSNPVLIVAELSLVGIAFARVAGYLNLLIRTFELEPGVYIFAAMTAASLFWSADPGETMNGAIVFIAVTLYASYLVIRFSLDQIIRLLAVMFTLSAVINLAFIVAFPQYGIDVDGQLTGVFGQKNALGYIAALAVPTLIIAGRAWSGGRLIFYPSILIHVGLLIGSESKTMLVATAVPTISIFFYQAFRARRTLPGAVLLGLVGSSVFTLAFATANIGLLAQWLDKDVTLTGRIPLWESLLSVAWERPLLGHGYRATFGGFFSPIHEVWIQNQWNPSHAHNALLQISLEIGLIGAAVYLFVYLRAVTRAIRIAAVVPGAVGLWPLVFLTTTLLVSITESGMTSELLGWTMLVVAVLSISGQLRHRRMLADGPGETGTFDHDDMADGQTALSASRWR
ncbi:MAG: O-antigen ligase family protein [Acidimicrobiia bacterium]|nr:O-antigen ligase family protein [Acidimicrobiia bacterium]